MPMVVGIRFKRCGRIYDFETDGVELRAGDRVIIETEFGLSIGNVINEPRSVEDTGREVKKIVRLATEEDFIRKEENERFAEEARGYCLERIMARGLPMRLVCTEVTLDRRRIIFFFTADGRIDFRELVKDLASRFRTRIEMRQIGVRDKAKLVGSLGVCGKEICCRMFLTAFEPISIKMAKQQELTLNTGKLSGVCGRLMCCLGYEYQEGLRGRGRPMPPPEEEEIPETETGEIGGLPEETILEERPPEKASAAVVGGGEAPLAEQKIQEPQRRRKKKRRRKKAGPKE